MYEKKTIPDYFLNKATEILKEKENGQFFCRIYYGMGCYWFVKKNNDAKYEYFFLHSDNHGQYSEESNHLPLLEKFLDGYIECDNEE